MPLVTVAWHGTSGIGNEHQLKRFLDLQNTNINTIDSAESIEANIMSEKCCSDLRKCSIVTLHEAHSNCASDRAQTIRFTPSTWALLLFHATNDFARIIIIPRFTHSMLRLVDCALKLRCFPLEKWSTNCVKVNSHWNFPVSSHKTWQGAHIGATNWKYALLCPCPDHNFDQQWTILIPHQAIGTLVTTNLEHTHGFNWRYMWQIIHDTYPRAGSHVNWSGRQVLSVRRVILKTSASSKNPRQKINWHYVWSNCELSSCAQSRVLVYWKQTAKHLTISNSVLLRTLFA